MILMDIIALYYAKHVGSEVVFPLQKNNIDRQTDILMWPLFYSASFISGKKMRIITS